MLDVKSVMEILNKSNGENLYEVVVPSTKQKVTMQPMTIGMRKTLSKFAMVDTKIEYLDFQLAKIGLVKSLNVSKDLDEYKLTEIDVISLLAQIMNNNLLENIILVITCNKCKTEFKTALEFQKIINICSGIEFPVVPYEKEINNIKYKLVLAKPYMIDMLTIEKAVASNSELNNNDMIINKPLLFVRDIFINDQQVEFKSIDEKLEVIENLPGKLVSGKNDIYEKILESFPTYASESVDLFTVPNCPKCNQLLGGTVTSDNFFIY